MNKRLPRASRPPEEPRDSGGGSVMKQEPRDSGVVVSLVKAVLDRIKDLSAIWGPDRSYVAVVTIVGLAFLHCARDNNIQLVAVITFIMMALCLPLLYRGDDEDGASA